MFPIFLFLVVFCFYNWLAYEPQQLSYQQHTEFAATKTIPTPPIQPIITFPVQPDNFIKAPETKTQIASKMLAKEPIREAYTTVAFAEKRVLEDIDNLKVRTARKVASALGIRQKANGVDKSLVSLQQEIRQQLESDYGQVVQALQLAKVG